MCSALILSPSRRPVRFATWHRPLETKLDRATIADIVSRGHSRIPVYEKGDKRRVVALLLIKDLAGVGFERQLPLATLLATLGGRERLHAAELGTRLDEALRKCQRERCHMLVVSNASLAAHAATAAAESGTSIATSGAASGGIIASGLVTMEDLLEEILQQEILDEDDLLPEAAAAPGGANESASGGAGGGDGGRTKTAKSWRRRRPSAEPAPISAHAPPDATALLSSLAALPSSPATSNGSTPPGKSPAWFRVPQLSHRTTSQPASPSKRSPKSGGENPPSGAAEMV